MLTVIEDIVIKELSGLCVSCIHIEGCVYRKNSDKIVIQCEVFESASRGVGGNATADLPLKGLCSNCSKSQYCSLPKEPAGVWHCEEYE